MCDKSTQTCVADDLELVVKEQKRKKIHRRSASFGQGDLSKELIKQRLQKTKEGSRHIESGKQRLSPVPGNHSALSQTAPPAVFAQTKSLIIPTNSHIPRQNMNRFQRNSVEGLNVEIEKLVLSKPTSSSAGQEPEEPDLFLRAQDIPDGHRAPIPEITRLSCTRSVDTQTPSAQVEEPRPGSSNSQPESLSPAVATLPLPGPTAELLHPDGRSDSVDSKSSKGDREFDSPEPSKFVSSPKPEKSCAFVRQPPDGCEKIKVIEDTRRPSIKEPLLFCPVKPNQFVFKPSQGSAFCPLIKQYLGEAADLSQALRPASVPITSALNQSPSIEGQ